MRRGESLLITQSWLDHDPGDCDCDDCEEDRKHELYDVEEQHEEDS